MPLSSTRLQSLLTADQVRALLKYDPETGKFARAGRPVGTPNPTNGYISIGISGNNYLAHRIAWLMHHNVWPEFEIDHINGDRSDNRISNLRLANRSENVRNSGIRSDNTTGAKGVSFSREHGMYRARIGLNGKRKHIGLFSTVAEASEAIERMRPEIHGEFARSK